MVSTKRNDEERSVTPSTDKKKRRTSLEPAELPTPAEQRQRAKDWAEKQKLEKTADITTEVPEKKKREIKTVKKNTSVEEPVELTTKSSRRLKKDPEPEESRVGVPTKSLRRSRKESESEEVVEKVKVSSRRPKRESLSELLVESQVVEEAPAAKKVKPSRRVRDEPVVEAETPFSNGHSNATSSSVREDSPFRSSTTSSNPSTASKSTTPYKSISTPVRQTDSDSVSTPEGSPTPVKIGRTPRQVPARTPVQTVEQPTPHSPFLPIVPTSDLVLEKEVEEVVSPVRSPAAKVQSVESDVDASADSQVTCCTGGVSSALRYVFVALVLSAWVFALYLDQTVGGLALAGFAVLFALKRVFCWMCVEGPRGVPHAESSDYYLASAASRQQQQKKSD